MENETKPMEDFTINDEALINKYLPKELIFKILGYLDFKDVHRCAQVCKYWNYLTLDKSVWRNFDLSIFRSVTTEAFLESRLQKSAIFLRRLSLSGCVVIGDSSIKTLAELCPHIEDLDLSQCWLITDNACQHLSQYCTKLHKLNLTLCDQITDESLKALSIGCKNLTHIDVTSCRNLTDKGLEVFSKSCFKIKAFICSNLEIETLNFVKYWPSLEVISLTECGHISDLLPLALHCPGLTFLCLSYCYNIDDSSMLALPQHWHKLKTLKLNTDITDIGIIKLIKDCKLLENIDLERMNITDATVVNLITECPRLKCINLAGCQNITDESIQQLINSPFIAENLEELDLNYCALSTKFLRKQPKYQLKLRKLVVANCELSDVALTTLSTSCKNLTYLDVSGCQNLSANGFEIFVKTCPKLTTLMYRQPATNKTIHKISKHCPLLENVDFGVCTDITDNAIQELVKCCLNLTSLDISVCSGLTDNSLIALGSHCHKKLTKLDLSNSRWFTDTGFKALFEGCTSLKDLNLSSTNVTDASLKSLAMNCTKLEDLVLTYCKQITDEGVGELARYQSAKTLREIDLLSNGKNVTENALKFLKECPNLQKLTVDDIIFTDNVKNILKAHLPGLKVHSIYQCVYPMPPSMDSLPIEDI